MSENHKKHQAVKAVSHTAPKIDRGGEGVRSLRVLLADDTPLDRMVAVSILEELGHSVMEAEGAGRVFELLARHSFDIVLMDVQMPIMDGLEITREIRSSQFVFSSIPIVAMTAHSIEAYKTECLDAGMNDYICKPLKAGEVAAILQRLLERPRATALEESVSGSEGLGGNVAIDETEALKRLGGNRELFREAMAVFIEDAGERLNILREEMERCDWAGFLKSAHRMKGGAASLSASGVSRAARELEDIGKTGDVAKARIGFLKLLAELEKVEKFALERFGIKGSGFESSRWGGALYPLD